MLENKEHNKNYKYIGIELSEEYLEISKARIEYNVDNNTKRTKEKTEVKPESNNNKPVFKTKKLF